MRATRACPATHRHHIGAPELERRAGDRVTLFLH
jgi:hypothetical protein